MFKDSHKKKDVLNNRCLEYWKTARTFSWLLGGSDTRRTDYHFAEHNIKFMKLALKRFYGKLNMLDVIDQSGVNFCRRWQKCDANFEQRRGGYACVDKLNHVIRLRGRLSASPKCLSMVAWRQTGGRCLQKLITAYNNSAYNYDSDEMDRKWSCGGTMFVILS